MIHNVLAFSNWTGVIWSIITSGASGDGAGRLVLDDLKTVATNPPAPKEHKLDFFAEYEAASAGAGNEKGLHFYMVNKTIF